jgi:hypothetical protein
MPGAVRDGTNRRGVNRDIAKTSIAIKKSAQLTALHHEGPTVGAGVGVLADNPLHIGGIGSAEPRRGGEGKPIQIAGRGDGDVTGGTVQFQRIDRDLIKYDRCGGRDPSGIVLQGAEESVPG